MSKVFDDFRDYIKRMNRYDQVLNAIYWDIETVMPKKGFDGHQDALSHFSTERFKMSVSEELKDYLDRLSEPEEFDRLNDHWKFVVTRMKRDYEKNARIPEEFYTEFVEKQAAAEQAWKEAKEASDFSIFEPHLQAVIDLRRKMTEYTDPGVEVYDALVNDFEEGMNIETIDRVFEELKEGLLPLIDRILAAPQPSDEKFRRTYDVDAQKKVQKLLLDYIGFTWENGAVGETEHPFTTSFSSRDVRIANHFREEDAMDPMFSAIHEGGHAIFDQNVDPEFDGTVAASCEYMGIHESQSRFYENILGRNINFWKPIYPEVQRLLPEFSDISLQEFIAEVNHVKNSNIRIMADEVTYCLHIIIRYEIEKEIFRNNLKASELPALWNRKTKEYLHITPANDAEGILQDSHWSGASFGYFPSYLLGSIYDGMFIDALEEEMGDIDTILSEGRIKEITKWLNAKIHRYGNTRTPREVIDAVCHKEVSAKPLLKYFRDKYAEIYKIEL